MYRHFKILKKLICLSKKVKIIYKKKQTIVMHFYILYYTNTYNTIQIGWWEKKSLYNIQYVHCTYNTCSHNGHGE